MRKIIIFLFLVISISCVSNTNEIKTAYIEYKVAESTAQNVDTLLNKLSVKSIIKLNTHNDNFIAQVSKIVCVDSRIYILDKSQSKIFIYNMNGDYIGDIDKKGRSKQEYLSLIDYDVNERGDIAIVDNYGGKVIIYTNELKFLKSFSILDDITLSPNGIKFLSNDVVVLLNEPSSSERKRFCIFDLDGKLIAKRMDISDEYANIFETMQGLYATYVDSDGLLCIKSPLENKVYAMGVDTIYCKYNIVFEGRNSDESILSKSSYISDRSSNNYGYDYISNRCNVKLLSHKLLVENDNMILCEFTPKSALSYEKEYMIYDKNKKSSEYYILDRKKLPNSGAEYSNSDYAQSFGWHLSESHIVNDSEFVVAISNKSMKTGYEEIDEVLNSASKNESYNYRLIRDKLVQLNCNDEDVVLMFFSL